MTSAMTPQRASTNRPVERDVTGYDPTTGLPAPPGYHVPDLTWMTWREAREALNRLHNVPADQPGVSTEAIQQACLRYRHRMEGRERDDQPIDPQRAAHEDPTPGPRELRCIWKPWPHRKMYLIDPSPANLRHLRLHWPTARSATEKVGRGRLVGRGTPRATAATPRAGQPAPSAKPKARSKKRAPAKRKPGKAQQS